MVGTQKVLEFAVADNLDFRKQESSDCIHLLHLENKGPFSSDQYFLTYKLMVFS